jgi:hypothetical protein
MIAVPTVNLHATMKSHELEVHIPAIMIPEPFYHHKEYVRPFLYGISMAHVSLIT